jgi:hypothetical protein
MKEDDFQTITPSAAAAAAAAAAENDFNDYNDNEQAVLLL